MQTYWVLWNVLKTVSWERLEYLEIARSFPQNAQTDGVDEDGTPSGGRSQDYLRRVHMLLTLWIAFVSSLFRSWYFFIHIETCHNAKMPLGKKTQNVCLRERAGKEQGGHLATHPIGMPQCANFEVSPGRTMPNPRDWILNWLLKVSS